MHVKYRQRLIAGVVHNPADVAATGEVCGNVRLQEVGHQVLGTKYQDLGNKRCIGYIPIRPTLKSRLKSVLSQDS